ncbi:sugar transferase [Natronocalculus amylovorans]|uniref:Sugar transferase n=1 Tax=Natronocalculus amylovorans TaxID=2917812 RepID=A0AAE3FZF6_9EURY|nr:sugar transferase [Natronocalculus amylovorans]MCL9817474.1 sugar transferase [Natronocalculus amylovorans]
MIHGWWYRSCSLIGAVLITAVGVVIANHPFAQALTTTYVPLLWRLDPVTLTGDAFQIATWTSVVLVAGALVPLFKPRPWRVLDVITYTQKRVVVAGLALATLGYFNWSYRLPRSTLAILIAVLLVLLPLWFVLIRTKTPNDHDRTIIVGDDLAQIEEIAASSSGEIVGYLSPPITYADEPPQHDATQPSPIVADGSGASVNDIGLPRLGGLSKLETVLLEHDIDTVCLAYRTADRGEFFGTLDLCHKHGVAAKVHREYADDVLTSAEDVSTLARVDVEPWDPQDYVFKRLFDIGFAGFGLLVLSPLVVVISIAIKLDSPGPIFYTQDRTAGFGDTFPVYKFRSMVPEGDSAAPVDDAENDRITRVGRVLRKTHMDEVPQLWSILVGNMSVVGPRAAWTEEERILEQETDAWRKRWFVKPGLTGLAQINGAKSTDPDMKLRYDLQYIRKQSFWFDLTIVIRQLWQVAEDVIRMIVQNTGKINKKGE